MIKSKIWDIARKRLSQHEMEYLQNINFLGDNIYSQVLQFDRILNAGVGLHNINDENSRGRYHIKDREIFRPFQYIEVYLKMDYQQIEWLTREIIHMCGLHLESLIKRLLTLTRMPLGQALTLRLAGLRLDRQLLDDLKVIVKPYNDAKHSLLQPKDSHFFDIQTTILCYAVTRKLSIELLSVVNLYTPEYVWV
ncbi:hypothetical protein [Mesobacillus subterraneus]|uniref:hypothetical protein n=1 Tax=Mesobacillus subterraneus TaxID=285983 RepID=UPI001CFF3432|nr:hypothetical protein [Mesobacillus subterraneus]